MVDLGWAFSGALRQQWRFLYGRFCIPRYFHSFARSRSSCWSTFFFKVWEEHFSTIWSLIIFSKVPKSQDFTSSESLVTYLLNDSSAFCAFDLSLWRFASTFRFEVTYPFKAVLASSRLLCSPGSVLEMHCTVGPRQSSIVALNCILLFAQVGCYRVDLKHTTPLFPLVVQISHINVECDGCGGQ